LIENDQVVTTYYLVVDEGDDRSPEVAEVLDRRSSFHRFHQNSTTPSNLHQRFHPYSLEDLAYQVYHLVFGIDEEEEEEDQRTSFPVEEEEGFDRVNSYSVEEELFRVNHEVEFDLGIVVVVDVVVEGGRVKEGISFRLKRRRGFEVFRGSSFDDEGLGQEGTFPWEHRVVEEEGDHSFCWVRSG
jgi:hypothetical protein